MKGLYRIHRFYLNEYLESRKVKPFPDKNRSRKIPNVDAPVKSKYLQYKMAFLCQKQSLKELLTLASKWRYFLFFHVFCLQSELILYIITGYRCCFKCNAESNSVTLYIITVIVRKIKLLKNRVLLNFNGIIKFFVFDLER